MEKRVRRIDPTLVVVRRTRVAAYARVSSGKDAMLHSLSAQVSYYSAMIQRHIDWEYAGVYADKAYTGTKEDRPEFQRLLADCRSGKIDRVITKSVSRFARNSVTLLETVRELKLLGISVYFEEPHIDSLSKDGELMLTILASIAQEESRATSENCKWRIRNDFKRGKPINLELLYGYRRANGVIEIDPDQAEIVREIFADYLRGVGSPTIAQRLRERNAVTQYNNYWTATHIRYMLKNEKYAGNALLQKTFTSDHLTKKTHINRGELPMYYVEESHPAIISKETYDRVQQRMAENAAVFRGKKPRKLDSPFTRMIVCGICGARFRRKTTHDRVSWQCNTFIEHGKRFCSAKQIPETTLLSLTCEALEIPVFDMGVFREQIAEIRVPKANTVVFAFRDGSESVKTWKDRSRAESWTDEMKKRAAEDARKRGTK